MNTPGSHRLSPTEAALAKSLFEAGWATHDVASLFNAAPGHITDVRRGVTHQHVEPLPMNTDRAAGVLVACMTAWQMRLSVALRGTVNLARRKAGASGELQ